MWFKPETSRGFALRCVLYCCATTLAEISCIWGRRRTLFLKKGKKSKVWDEPIWKNVLMYLYLQSWEDLQNLLGTDPAAQYCLPHTSNHFWRDLSKNSISLWWFEMVTCVALKIIFIKSDFTQITSDGLIPVLYFPFSIFLPYPKLFFFFFVLQPSQSTRWVRPMLLSLCCLLL